MTRIATNAGRKVCCDCADRSLCSNHCFRCLQEFAQIAVGARDSAPGYPCPPFKIIILDEADSMTKDAQSALRRTMEQYTKVTRFAIICNYVSRSGERTGSMRGIRGCRCSERLRLAAHVLFVCSHPSSSVAQPHRADHLSMREVSLQAAQQRQHDRTTAHHRASREHHTPR
jgi:hypothetical protein